MPAVIPIVGAVVGGVIANNGAKKAANTQAAAADRAGDLTLQGQREAIAFQQQQADRARADNEPWRQAGVNALTQLSSRVASGGDLMRNFGAADFEADPGYAFRQAEGMKGMTNSAAARGGLLSGAALKAAGSYNQNLASAEFGNAASRFKSNQDGQFNRLASLAGVGQTAAGNNAGNAMQLGGNVGGMMMNTGNQLAQNAMGVGNVRASSYMAQGNALTGVINQGISAWGNTAAKPAMPGTAFDGYGYAPNGSY